MEPDDATPTCMHCREPLRPGARRCPACLSWQSRWGADTRNPGLEIALVGGLVIAMALMTLAWAWLSRGPEQAPRGNHAASLEVVESDLEILGSDRHTTLVAVGAVHNRSDLALRDLFFYVQLLDREGRTIDAFHARMPTMVVPPRGQAVFKLPDRDPLRDVDAYADCAVEVRYASAVP